MQWQFFSIDQEYTDKSHYLSQSNNLSTNSNQSCTRWMEAKTQKKQEQNNDARFFFANIVYKQASTNVSHTTEHS